MCVCVQILDSFIILSVCVRAMNAEVLSFNHYSQCTTALIGLSLIASLIVLGHGWRNIAHHHYQRETPSHTHTHTFSTPSFPLHTSNLELGASIFSREGEMLRQGYRKTFLKLLTTYILFLLFNCEKRASVTPLLRS